ncbi:MAG TPA: zinc ribbon domain-containing protein [Ktedonobacteraceae bacterium]|nr:zinc ribbon domain-containing protein [Ktedonobacteraceae bacterium]
MKSLTGQYECVHGSGLGLDYFTSHIDRLTLQANGRFSLIVQEKSRIGHAAKSLLSGQQVDMNAPEVRRDGRYSAQGNIVTFFFDDGAQEQGQLAANDGLQIGNNFFEKVSDSTLLPPTHRLKSNMEDIAKGLKIAGAIGGTAIKAVKTIQDSIQSAQGQHPTSTSNPPSQQNTYQPSSYQPPQNPPPAQPTYTAPPAQGQGQGQNAETLFCDQCGKPVRPGKLYCNHCGARLP